MILLIHMYLLSGDILPLVIGIWFLISLLFTQNKSEITPKYRKRSDVISTFSNNVFRVGIC